jgi:uncharacterized protein (DUF58 family)
MRAAPAALTASLRAWGERVLSAAERRLPALTRLRRAEPLPIRLDRRRIYVTPTRFGAAFGLLLFVMLLGALNYGNNPALLLTCLLGAASGASVFPGFRIMNGLVLAQVQAPDVHAGEGFALRLRFAPSSRGRPNLRVVRAGTETAFALPPGSQGEVAIPVPGAPRGWFRPGRIRLWTNHPLGLFQVWSWVHPASEHLVYPAPETPAPPLPSGDGRQGEQAHAGASEERDGLRDYRPSDAARLIAWKASVRHDALLVRDVERHAGEVLSLDYTRLPGLDREARLRRLAAWVLAADAARRSYALLLPGETVPAGLGAAHRHACLRALALLPGQDGDRG